jgi:hypothetical protein
MCTVLNTVVSRVVRVQGWPGLKLSCDLGTGQQSKQAPSRRVDIITRTKVSLRFFEMP